jgi:hypothetical protein
VGGPGSGRTGNHPTIEATASYVLPASVLKQLPPDRNGQWQSTLTFGDGFQVGLGILASAGRLSLEFRHPIRAGDKHEITYEVRAVAKQVHLGGQRWWWICPRTGRHVFKLYLPLGGWQFWSRQAYGLGYASQRISRFERRARRARTLHRALGGDGLALGQSPPPRPKGMRQRTYERKVAAWREADDSASEAWMQGVSGLLGRYRAR